MTAAEEIGWLGGWLAQQVHSGPGRFYFMTLTFDRYRDRYPASLRPRDKSPTRDEVKAGHTVKMKPADASEALRGDVRRFYLRVVRKLLGRRYADRRWNQPVGIGAIDQPVYKSPAKRSALARRPGEVFSHAHIVLFVRDDLIQRSPPSLCEMLEQLYASQELLAMWRRFNPEGELHMQPATNVGGALDYATKTAKLSDAVNEHIVLLPF